MRKPNVFSLRRAAAVLAIISAISACRGDEPKAPEPAAVKAEAVKPRGRLIMLGFDGVDPDWLDRYVKEGKLPTLAKLTQSGAGKKYMPLRSSNPPQSPVAWTSFATGTEPGDHGIFDFIGRSLPQAGALRVVPRVATTSFDVQDVGPPVARNLRTGEPFWQTLGNQGVRVIALNVPYSFPPDPMREGRMLSGLGVPDLRETNSTFTYVGTDVTEDQVKKPPGGGVMVPLKVEQGVGKFVLEGPSISGGDGKRMALNAELTVNGKDATGTLKIGAASVTLHSQAMSDWLELDFEHDGQKVRGIGRAMLLELGVQTRLFITPLSMHPRAQYSPFTYPRALGAQLADEVGLYKTVGWDHDTSALNAEVVDDGVFLADMNEIETQRRKMLMDRLAKPDWDLLIWVSTATDRVAHMFYRLIDPQHPRYDAALAARYGTAIEDEYKRMDATVAEVLTKLGPDDTLLILSDHGFHGYRRGLHVNQWLRQQGLLALKDGAVGSPREFLFDVDWSKTKAYALGTGQVYLNRAGRERDGIVTDGDAQQVLEQIKSGLLALRDKDRADAQVVAQVYAGSEVFAGGRAADAPELQIAFAEHYRTSWETILGGVPEDLFADNTKKWSGDHSASDVADTDGILISNRPLNVERAAIVDLAPTALSFFAKKAEPGHVGKPLLSAP